MPSQRLSPGIHWARKCWRRAPPGATGAPGSLRYSTRHCPWGPRWPVRRPAGPQGCGRRGCTGSSWTGCSGCRSRSAAAGAAEPAGPRNAARSWPSWRTLCGKTHNKNVLENLKYLFYLPPKYCWRYSWISIGRLSETAYLGDVNR